MLTIALRFVIACTKKLPSHLTKSVVGHLPKEVSRYTYYIILHGAKVTAMVMDTHHRRSPLVLGGLEIPIQVTVEMDLTEENRQCLDKYETLVGDKYKEPVDGKFLYTTKIEGARRLEKIRTRTLTLT